MAYRIYFLIDFMVCFYLSLILVRPNRHVRQTKFASSLVNFLTRANLLVFNA